MAKNIGEVISIFRKNMNMTQAMLGEKIGLNRVTIAKIENNQRAISLDEAIKVSNVFSIDVDKLYSNINESNNEKEDIFVLAFKAKGISEEKLVDVKRIELLVDALFTQNDIYRGE